MPSEGKLWHAKRVQLPKDVSFARRFCAWSHEVGRRILAGLIAV